MPATVSSPTSSPGDAEAAGDETAPVAFGKYRLHYRIARGGMGEVYRASLVGEFGFEKPLVIKTILPELASQERFIDLFAAEAKTAVALSHGNIVPIYELGRANDTFYIVMGYVDGPSVAQLLGTYRRSGRPPPLAVTLAIIREVLTGLAYAHTDEPGRPAVVHRDITPRNIMVDRSGQVRIVDFGIARPARERVSVRAGSTGYIAPEQARAEAADPRADVFSCACLLYELLTLERAFPSEGVWTSPGFDKVPALLDPPLRRALSLDPAERPANAGAFLQALGGALAKHAATFIETDLAAHLRTLYPNGNWGPPPTSSSGELTPATEARPRTQTFATRLTAITAEPDVEAEDQDEPSELSEPSTPEEFATLDSVAPRRETTTSPIAAATAPEPAAAPSRRVGAWIATAVAGAAALWLMQPATAPSSATSTDGRDDPVAPPAAVEVVSSQPRPEDAAPTLQSSPPDDGPPPPPPAMVIHVEPPGATILVGTTRFEGGSPFTLPLPATGELKALIEHPGYTPQTLVLRAGEPGEQRVDLSPAAQGRGYLRVLAPSVSWAEVTVDGRRRGITPIRKLELSEGSHRVAIHCVPDVCPERKQLLRRTVTIKPGELTRVSAD